MNIERFFSVFVSAASLLSVNRFLGDLRSLGTASLPGVDELEVVGGDVGSGLIGGGGAGEKCGRRLPEQRSPDGEADRRRAGGGRGEAPIHRGEIGRLAEAAMSASGV